MGLTFEERTHTYRLDGRVLPSVSQLLEPLSGAEYSNIPASVLSAAADRGTEIHRAIENYIIFGEENIAGGYINYLEAFEDWFYKNKPEVICTERQMYHPVLLYAGTPDLICRTGDDVCLVDYKSSSKVIDKVYRVQMEAYRQMIERNMDVFITKKILLHLKNSGNYEEILYPAVDTEAWRVFGALRTIYAYKCS